MIIKYNPDNIPKEVVRIVLLMYFLKIGYLMHN